MGRQPNTDYHVRLMHFKQRIQTANSEKLKANADRLLKDKITIKYDKHAEKKNFYRKIEDRVNRRMEDYEAEIEKRRDKYLNLRNPYFFIIQRLQITRDVRPGGTRILQRSSRQSTARPGIETRRHEAALAGNSGKTRERTRRLSQTETNPAIHVSHSLKISRRPSIEFRRARAVDLRPQLARKNLIESKEGQLQQIRENEARRAAEREMDMMWYDLMMREYQAKVLHSKPLIFHR